MKRLMTGLLLIPLLTTSAWAQDGNQQDQPRRPDRQRGGDRGGRGGGQDGGGRGFDRMVNRVIEQLDLDDQQKAKFNDMVAAQRERMAEMGQRWQAVRQAETDGDTQRAAQLRAEMGNGQRRGGNPMDGILDELEPILRPDQVEKLDEMRSRMERDNANDPRRRMGELTEELQLDETQKAKFDEIMNAQREQMRERMGDQRAMFEEMRDARESGDEARSAELQAKMDKMGAERQAGMLHALSELEPLLRDDQKAILNDYREQAKSGKKPEAGRGDVRTILRTAKRLSLDKEQSDQLKEIEREALSASREAKTREARTELATSTTEQIRKLLTADQAERFDRMLQRLDRANSRERSGARDGNTPERRPRRAEPVAAPAEAEPTNP